MYYLFSEVNFDGIELRKYNLGEMHIITQEYDKKKQQQNVWLQEAI